MIAVEKLTIALADIYNRWPSALISANAVGNLVVQVDGKWIGWIDISNDVRTGTGEFSTFGGTL